MSEEYITSRDSYGKLLNPDAKLHRQWFKEMTKLIGINVIYKAPVEENKVYNINGEIVTSPLPSILVGCIFDEHPNQYTTKKLGWNAEMQEGASIIHVPYDLPGIQIGAQFIVPSGIDNSVGRIFRVIRMSNIMIYPASIACQIIPEYKNDFEQSQFNHSDNNFNLLIDEED